jgi:hypothetical protein
VIRDLLPGDFDHRRRMMSYYVGLEVSQKITAIFIVNATGDRSWRGMCISVLDQIEWPAPADDTKA